MRVFGEVVLGEAVRNAPVEEGTLRGSATLDVDNSAPLHPRDGSTISVLVAFPVPYAAYQHEHTELSHPKGGSAKFLESAIQAHTPALERALAAGVNIESAFGGIGLASDGGAQIQEREL